MVLLLLHHQLHHPQWYRRWSAMSANINQYKNYWSLWCLSSNCSRYCPTYVITVRRKHTLKAGNKNTNSFATCCSFSEDGFCFSGRLQIIRYLAWYRILQLNIGYRKRQIQVYGRLSGRLCSSYFTLARNSYTVLLQNAVNIGIFYKGKKPDIRN